MHSLAVVRRRIVKVAETEAERPPVDLDLAPADPLSRRAGEA